MKTFSDRLNAAMQAAQISQGQLASMVGISQPAIQKMTSGKTSGTKKLVPIAMALGVRPEWLASGIGSMRDDSEMEGALPVVALGAPRELTPEEEELLEIFRSLPDEEVKRFMAELKAKKAHYDAIFEEMLKKRHGKAS